MKVLITRLTNVFADERVGSDIVNSISAIFIALFVYTASDKLFGMNEFVSFIKSLEMMEYFGTFLAWSIPVSEILISMLLLFPLTRFKGLIASGGLMLVFTVYLMYMKLTVAQLPCHCGGAISRLSWSAHIWFNLLLIILAGLAIILNWRFKRKL